MVRPRPPEPGRLALLAAVAGLALAAAGPAPAAEPEPLAPASGGSLRIAADPPRLVLGQDGSAELQVAAPAEVEELSLTTSVGRIEGLRRLPGGGFAARLRVPSERYPQVAIVAALAQTQRGVADGWLAVPLYGQGDARVRAAPGAKITLRIGERSFGPRTAGSDGVAVIPVVVPPGVREAHHGFRPIELHVPETPLVHAVADRSSMLADRQQHVRVLAYVVAPHGTARRGDVPVFEVTRGSVAVSPREPGAFEAVWTVPPGLAGEERIAVKLPGAPASRALVKVGTLPGPPVTVAVSFDREAVVAGEEGDVAVSARVLDAAGNVTDALLDLRAEAGELADVKRVAPGAWQARLRIDPRFEGRRELVVAALAPEIGIAGSRALRLRPAAAASATVDERVLVGDGKRETSLAVSVYDRFDNPVAATPAVSAELGRVLAVAEEAPGSYRVRYVGAHVEERTEDRLTIEVGSVRAEGAVVLVPPRSTVGAIAGFGVAKGLSRGPVGKRFAAAVERDERVWRGFDLSSRVEVELLAFEGRAREVVRGALDPEARATARVGALLAGVTARRDLKAGPTAWGTLSAGVAVSRARGAGADDLGVGPSARVALGVGWRQRKMMPFLEASLVAAGDAPLRVVPAFALTGGVRFDVEKSHGDHPDRR
jgi:hypothetical protein